jgi:hypothetical protein
MTDHETDYRQAERQLREFLFGDGSTSVGVLKGEERRLLASRILRRMRQAFDEAADQAKSVGAATLHADLADELKKARDRAERET